MKTSRLLILPVLALMMANLISSCAVISVGSLDYAKNRADENTFFESISKNYDVGIPVDSITQDSLRVMFRVMEILEGEDDTVYFGKLRQMNPFHKPQAVDSLLKVWICRLDLLSGPQTPQNEKWEELKRRIKFCNEHYFPRGSHYEYWDDIRHLVVIKFGTQFVSSSIIFNVCWDDFLGFQTPENTSGKAKPIPTCFIDNIFLKTPDGERGFGFEGDMSDMRAHRVVPYSDNVSGVGSVTDIAALARKEMQNQKEKLIDAPGISVDLFPDVKKQLDILASVTMFPQDSGYLCFLAGGIDNEKVRGDSIGLASILIKRRALYNSPIPKELYFDSSMALYKVKSINGYAYPFSLIYPLPDSGEYLLIASASTHDGLGVITASVSTTPAIQSSEKISGLMLLDSPMRPDFEGGSAQFTYRGKAFFGKPKAAYEPGDSVYLLVEVEKPDSAENRLGYDILSQVFLKPLSRDEGEVLYGPIEIVEVFSGKDSLGRPIKSNLPGTVISKGQFRPEVSGKYMALVASSSYHTNEFFPRRELIALSLRIPKNFPRRTHANCRVQVSINGKPAEWTYRIIEVL